MVGELEALAALAAYGYEHPADPFPELVDDGPGLVQRVLSSLLGVPQVLLPRGPRDRLDAGESHHSVAPHSHLSAPCTGGSGITVAPFHPLV